MGKLKLKGPPPQDGPRVLIYQPFPWTPEEQALRSLINAATGQGRPVQVTIGARHVVAQPGDDIGKARARWLASAAVGEA